MKPEDVLFFLVAVSLASLGYTEEVWDVIVIGAGIAGLSAARTLKAKGYKVLVLEARDRIGGRIWTRKVNNNNSVVDFGAQWIHGIVGNPISKVVRESNIDTVLTDYLSNTTYCNGQALSPAERDKIRDIYQNWKTFEAAAQETEAADVPLVDIVQRYAQLNNITGEEFERLLYSVNTTIEHEYGGSINSLSLFNWDQDGGVNGPDVVFPKGYSQVAESVAEGLDVRTNQVVKSIAYTRTGTTITTADGSVFSAKAAVVTLPLGVLKAGAVEFSPPLPPCKQKSIKALGMGLLQKIVLVFKHKFWDDTDLLGRIPPSASQRGQWCEYLNFHKYTKDPILVCFNAADYAWEVEKLSDAEVTTQAMAALRDMYGAAVPDPEESYVTRWGSDPYSLGSYSYIPVGASGDDYDTLAEPVGKTLFFAGEATHRLFPQTVHGAYMSGQAAAAGVAAAGVPPSERKSKPGAARRGMLMSMLLAA